MKVTNQSLLKQLEYLVLDKYWLIIIYPIYNSGRLKVAIYCRKLLINSSFFLLLVFVVVVVQKDFSNENTYNTNDTMHCVVKIDQFVPFVKKKKEKKIGISVKQLFFVKFIHHSFILNWN